MKNKILIFSFFLIALLLGWGVSAKAEPHGQSASNPNPNRYIVTFMHGAKGKAALQAAGAEIKLDLPHHDAVAAHIPEHALQGLRRNPHIEYIEPDHVRFPSGQVTPWGIDIIQANIESVMGTNASNRKICIIDSGYSLGHEDLPGNINVTFDSSGSTSSSFDKCAHGTHVAGTIAALNNDMGVLGVSSNGSINLHIVKVFGDDTEGNCSWTYSSGLIAALDTCVAEETNIVSMSLGGSFKSRTEERAFVDAFNVNGILSVAAAGNDGNTRKSYPASYNSVVSVAAIDSTKTVASFSQRNSQVEISAPGVNVRSTVPMGTGNEESVTVTVGTDTTEKEAISIQGSPDASGSGNLVACTTSSCPPAVSNGVCLIPRGDISFADKVLMCQAAGGNAAIIYNNVSGLLNGTLGEVTTVIPSVGISQADGLDIVSMLSNTPTASVTTAPGNYAYFDGTSMATPHVSSAAALVWSHADDNTLSCTNQDIRNVLNTTAEDLSIAGRDDATGFGLVQVADAIAAIDTDGCGGDSGGGGGGGGNDPCTDLAEKGASCSTDSECCSGACKGKPGSQSCK